MCLLGKTAGVIRVKKHNHTHKISHRVPFAEAISLCLIPEAAALLPVSLFKVLQSWIGILPVERGLFYTPQAAIGIVSSLNYIFQIF